MKTALSGNKKGIVFIIAAAMILSAVVFINNRVQQNEPNQNINSIGKKTRKEVLEELQTLNFLDTKLNEDQKKKYFDQFLKLREELRKSMVSASLNSTSSDAVLYWPVLYMGSVQRDAGDYEKAKDAYLLAHEAQPNAYPPLGNLADLYFTYYKDYEEAEKYYLLAIQIEGDYLEQYYAELHDLYQYQFRDSKKAEDLLVAGIQKYPDKFDLLAQLALHYRQLGDIPKAVEAYEKLLKRNPSSMVAKKALEELK